MCKQLNEYPNTKKTDSDVQFANKYPDNRVFVPALVKITILLVSTVARNSIYCNTGCCCGYMHDVTMTLCALSIKMYTRIY